MGNMSRVNRISLTLVTSLSLMTSVVQGAELEVGADKTFPTVQAAVDAAVAGDTILVHDGAYPEDVDLDGDGSTSARRTLRPAPGAQPVITGEMTIDGSFWDVVDLTLVARPGRRGIRLRGHDNRILGVDLSGGNRNGIDGGGLRNEVRGCHIHDFDAGDQDAHCIVLNPGAEGWIISDNDIHDCSGDCLQLFSDGVERSIRNLLVEGNEMYFTGALGRTENAVDVKNGDGLVFRRNRMYGFPDNKVVVFQKGPANIEMDCNEMSAGFNGVEFRGEDGGTVEGVVFTRNLVRDFTGYALKFDGTNDAVVYHNTFVAIDNDGLRIEGAGLGTGSVRNNLWVDTGRVEAGGFDASHNGFFNAETDIGSVDDVVADPQFDTMFFLGPGSPMIDAGVDVGLPFAGGQPDLGWHEVGGTGCDVPDGGPGGSGGTGGGGGASNPAQGGAGGNSEGPTGRADAHDGDRDDAVRGCGCRQPRQDAPSPGAPAILAVLGLGVAGRRRARRCAPGLGHGASRSVVSSS